MKNYSTMNTMQCFSSQNSLSNSSKDSKQMFLTTRRGEPLIPTSNYLQNHHLQNQNILNQQQQQQQQQQQNYPCVHPHHTVLSSSCSPSISSNSINVWTTINNSAGVKQSIDKVPPHYSALTTLGRLNTLHNTNLHNNSLLNSNLVHNKQNNHRKDTFRWRSNDKGFCFLLLIIGCILTFVLLIFSLIFYFIVFKQGVTFDLNTPNKTVSTALITSNLVNNNKFNPNLKPDTIDKFKQIHQSSSTYEQPKMKRKRLINKIDGELRIMNKQFKLRDYDNEILQLKQVLNNFIQRNLNLCLNNTEITQYRRGDNHNLNGIIVNFILSFDCALPNLPKRLAFALRDSFKSDYQIDFRTLRLTPVFDQQTKIEYVDVLESETDNWLKFTKNSEWGKWTEWSQCDCKNGLVVKSRQRTCLNKTTNKSAFSFSCGTNNDDNDEHLPSVEIRNCGCEQVTDNTQFDKNNQPSSINSQQSNNPEQFELAICSRCEKTNEICLSYNSQMPNCLKILNYDDKCGGHCNSKGTECKYVKEKYLHQCIHTNETTDGNLCLDDEFKCLDGLCIPNIKYCDGFPNCFDSSDEVGCQCDIESGEYMLCSANTTSCIHISKRCDQNEDCLHGEDEIGCFTNCPSEDEVNSNQFFHCLSGSKECIPIDKLCDNVRDCFDGSDEINCKLTNLNQHRNRFNMTN